MLIELFLGTKVSIRVSVHKNWLQSSKPEDNSRTKSTGNDSNYDLGFAMLELVLGETEKEHTKPLPCGDFIGGFRCLLLDFMLRCYHRVVRYASSSMAYASTETSI